MNISKFRVQQALAVAVMVAVFALILFGWGKWRSRPPDYSAVEQELEELQGRRGGSLLSFESLSTLERYSKLANSLSDEELLACVTQTKYYYLRIGAFRELEHRNSPLALRACMCLMGDKTLDGFFSFELIRFLTKQDDIEIVEVLQSSSDYSLEVFRIRTILELLPASALAVSNPLPRAYSEFSPQAKAALAWAIGDRLPNDQNLELLLDAELVSSPDPEVIYVVAFYGDIERPEVQAAVLHVIGRLELEDFELESLVRRHSLYISSMLDKVDFLPEYKDREESISLMLNK